MCTSEGHHSKRRKSSSWLCALCCCCVLCATNLTVATENVGVSHSPTVFPIASSHNKHIRRNSDNSPSSTETFINSLNSVEVNLTDLHQDEQKCYQVNGLIHKISSSTCQNLTDLFHILNSSKNIIDWKACPKQFHEPSVPENNTKVQSYKDWKVWVYTFISVTLISIAGLVAVALIPLMHQAFYHILIQFLISLAVGSLVGDALLHLIPHALFPHEKPSSSVDDHDHNDAYSDPDHHHPAHPTSCISHKDAIYMSIMGLVGVLVFFVAERIVIVYQMWKAKSKDAGYLDSSASVSSKHSSVEPKERSSDYRTALNSHNSELEESDIVNDRRRGYNVPSGDDNYNAGIVPLVQVISSSRPLLASSLPKISNPGLSPVTKPSNGDLINDRRELSPHFQTSSAQMSPSKKHRLGWGCVQHVGALSALEPVPQHVSHSADVLFCGNCNQPPILQTRTDCNDPMDEESCLKGRHRKSPSSSKDLRSSMPFLALRTSDHDGDHHSHKHLASDEAPMLHDTNHHAFVRSTDSHHHHHHHQHSHEIEVVGHCHGQGLQQRNPRPHSHHHGHSHDLSSVRSIAYTILAGDGLHNFCDGIAIGAAFAAHISDGLAVSLAVLCHELPHELGDFAVLLHAGIPVRSAIYYNVFSSILCYIGAIIGVLTGSNSSTLGYVFMFTAGMFLYIALVDMVPELTTQRLRGNQLFTNPICLLSIHTLGIVLGGSMMLAISLIEKH